MEKNTTRRGFLGSSAALAAALAGCQDRKSQENSTGTKNQTDTEELRTVDDSLEPTEEHNTDNEENQDTERSLDQSVQLINNVLNRNYSPVEGETIAESVGPDGNPTVSINLDMSEVYDQTPFEDFDRQNVRYIDEAGHIEQFIGDLSVPVTETFMTATSMLAPNSGDYSSINIDIVGSDRTSLGLTIDADRAQTLNEELQSDYNSNDTAPSGRMERAMNTHRAIGSYSDRSEAVFYVPEGDSHTVKISGEDNSFIVDDAFSNERTSLLKLDFGQEDNQEYQNSDHEYQIDDNIFLEIEEINPNNERYGEGASFRVGLEGNECSREISVESGESNTYMFGDSEETVEYLNVHEDGSGVLKIEGELVEMNEAGYELSENGVLYRMDQSFRNDQYSNGEMELEAIFNCS